MVPVPSRCRLTPSSTCCPGGSCRPFRPSTECIACSYVCDRCCSCSGSNSRVHHGISGRAASSRCCIDLRCSACYGGGRCSSFHFRCRHHRSIKRASCPIRGCGRSSITPASCSPSSWGLPSMWPICSSEKQISSLPAQPPPSPQCRPRASRSTTSFPTGATRSGPYGSRVPSLPRDDVARRTSIQVLPSPIVILHRLTVMQFSAKCAPVQDVLFQRLGRS